MRDVLVKDALDTWVAQDPCPSKQALIPPCVTVVRPTLSIFCLSKNKIDLLVSIGWPTCEGCSSPSCVLACESLEWGILVPEPDSIVFWDRCPGLVWSAVARGSYTTTNLTAGPCPPLWGRLGGRSQVVWSLPWNHKDLCLQAYPVLAHIYYV